jgi:hypothetical protein
MFDGRSTVLAFPYRGLSDHKGLFDNLFSGGPVGAAERSLRSECFIQGQHFFIPFRIFYAPTELEMQRWSD